MFKSYDTIEICILGLGYVGLPLAVEFGKKYRTVGFDLNEHRIQKPKAGIDETKEIDASELTEASGLAFTTSLSDITSCNVYIVTVPTPIDKNKKPDLDPLIQASKSIGSILKAGDLVIYESTVYPGVTEEECVPVLERISGLKFNLEFFVGYSPERINPGDKKHVLKSIIKVVSGSTPQVANFINDLYASIIDAGTYKAESIKVAEAAKVIENTQRDVNIALINELTIIFEKLNIDTESVLKAAATKWNFLNFSPGLVGGHCIGVDPYYLTHKAEALGYHPVVILAGRRLNDGMGAYCAQRVIKNLIRKKIQVNNAKILVLGLTFKENCPDLRNTKVVDLIHELSEFGANVDVHDPVILLKLKMSMELGYYLTYNFYDGVVIAVAHDIFKELK